MKNGNETAAVCPICGREYYGHPALSRTDNETPICPDCGIRQALTDAGFAAAEQEAVLEVIHRHNAMARMDK